MVAVAVAAMLQQLLPLCCQGKQQQRAAKREGMTATARRDRGGEVWGTLSPAFDTGFQYKTSYGLSPGVLR